MRAKKKAPGRMFGPGACRASRARAPVGDVPTLWDEGQISKRGGQRQSEVILIRSLINLRVSGKNSIFFYDLAFHRGFC